MKLTRPIFSLLEHPSLSSPASRPNNQQPTNQIERMKNTQPTSQTLTCPALHLPLAGRLWQFLLALLIGFAYVHPAAAALPKVAVYGSDHPAWTAEVVAKLVASGSFSQVDNLSPLGCQADPTPTLARLQQYSAVLVYSNCRFNDPVALGNVLADYVDGGGGVVVSTFALWTENVIGIGGRFDNGGYLPVTQGSQTQGTRRFLVADLPADPLLAGVSSFDGGSSSYHNAPLSLVPGATLVAHWTDGVPLVVKKGRVVAVNIFPPSSDSRSDFWNAATDGARLLANALNTVSCEPFRNTHLDVAVVGGGYDDSFWQYSTLNGVMSGGPGASTWSLTYITTAQLTTAGLANYDVLIVLPYTRGFVTAQIQTDLAAWVSSGGTLIISPTVFPGTTEPLLQGLGANFAFNWDADWCGHTPVFPDPAHALLTAPNAIGTVASGNGFQECDHVSVSPTGLGSAWTVVASVPSFGNRIVLMSARAGAGAVLVPTSHFGHNTPGQRNLAENLIRFGGCGAAPNNPPVADAGPDATVSADANCQAAVTLNGAGSSDPDGDTLTFAWSGSFGTASGVAPTVVLGLGTHTITLTVDDSYGNTASDSVLVTVVDTSAPAITGCPANVTVRTGPGRSTCDQVVSWTPPTATDNCSLASFTSTHMPGDTFPVGTTTVTCIATDAANNSTTCSFTVTVVDDTLPVIPCPADITVNNDPGVCGALVTYAAPVGTDNCAGATTAQTAGLPSGATFPIGTTVNTFEVTDAAGNKASCSFRVTVVDNENPKIACPADITVNNDPGACGAVVAYATPAGTDNCAGATTAQTAGLPSGATFPVGTTVNTFEVTDAAGNKATCTFRVTVVDNELPTIACPADVVVNADALVCTAIVSGIGPISAGDNCPGAAVTYTLSGATTGSGLNDASGLAFNLGTTTVTYTITDAAGLTASCSFTVTVLNPNPVVTLTGPPSGSLYAVNTPVTFTATFTDAGGGTHTGTWMFDALTQAATVVEPNGATPGSASATYTFTAAGVYTVKLTLNDSCGGSGTADQIGGMDLLVVVYDPSAGFVTGGGWIQSPAGAYLADPTMTGKANFGFVSKYQKGATTPTGNTEFQFKTGNLNFSSTVYQWLVVSGAKAQYKGDGTINGTGNYGFLLTTTDGQLTGGGGVDRFRIKIWDKATSAIVYDNVAGGSDDIDAADPQAIAGGSIVIHKAK
jgi:hypothetical protein